MSSRRIIIYGNSGAGKTTLVRQLQQQHDLPRLVLDSIAWEPEWGKRRPLQTSIADLRRFIDTHQGWIIEGCYGDLIEAALPYCTDLRFVNPAVEVCVANCRKRYSDWQKHRRPEDQRSPLEELLPWVRDYERRNDELSLACHRQIFDGFDGPKTEYQELPPM
jgi:adenylate kinase family enzyme